MKIWRLLQAGAQSGTVMTISDIGIQAWEKDLSLFSSSLEYKEGFDPQRTLRWTLAGVFLHGPYFLTSFSFLDQRFGTVASLSTVMKKTMVAQFVVFPPYLVALFGFMGVMENHPDVMNKIRQRVPEVFMTGCAFWPMANVVNFTFIAPTMRVPYLAACAGVWNSYLSWTNARDDDSKIPKIESLA